MATFKAFRTIALLAVLLGAGRALAAGNPDFDAIAWTPLGCDTPVLTADTSPGSVNFVGDATYPAAYYAIDANYLYFRYRMDRDPAGPGGFDSFTWTALMQVPSGNPFQYQYQLSLEGSGDNIEIWANTTAMDIDFSPLFHDDSEVKLYSQKYNLSNATTVNTTPLARRLPTGDGSNFGKDADYFIDLAFPVQALIATGAIADASDLAGSSFFPATSTNSNNYNKGHLNCPFLPTTDASIEKAVSPLIIPANAMTPVGYAIAVKNDGPVAAKGVVVDDIALASYLGNVTVDVSADDAGITWEVVSTNPLEVKIPIIPPGKTVMIGMMADATPTCADADFMNTASLTAVNAMDASDSALLSIHHLDGFELCDGADNDCNGTIDDGGDAICDDGDLCNGSETCGGAAGCQAGTPPSCDDGNACTADGCALGACTHTPVADGSSCDDGDACTQTDSCQGGSCTGTNPVVCTAADQCHAAGSCDPATGVCSSPTVADGTACNDGDGCTQTDSCTGGVCTGGNPVVCTASDQCHTAGTCNPATGVCTNPVAADGTACNDGDACTTSDSCQGGSCTGTNPVVCAAADQCHLAGTCDPASGLCSNPAAPDGTSCDDALACTTGDSCQAGSCTGTAVPGCVPCTTAADCADANVCTTDVCTGNGTCAHVDTPGCVPCTTSADCNDNNPCTSDECGPDGSCGITSLPGCELCNTAADCDDGNACTTEACTNGVCQHTADPSCQPREICGNCIDDDGDGLVDAEDPDCCSAPVALDLRKLKIRLAGGKAKGNRLRMKARSIQFAMQSMDPVTQDTSIQISDGHGQVFCQTIAAKNWKHPNRRTYRFRDKAGSFAGGLKQGNFKMKKSGKVLFRTRGKKVSLRSTTGENVLVTLRVGNQCAQTHMSLHTKGKGLVFP